MVRLRNGNRGIQPNPAKSPKSPNSLSQTASFEPSVRQRDVAEEAEDSQVWLQRVCTHRDHDTYWLNDAGSPVCARCSPPVGPREILTCVQEAS